MRNLSRGLLMAAAAAVAILLLIHKIASYDVWFHLRAGEWLLAGGGFPQQDPFSFTANARWINQSWLFQIPLALAQRLGGLSGITILNALILLGMMAIIVRAAHRARVATEVAATLLALAALASIQRLLVRPESLSLLFLVVAITVVEAALRGRTRLLWAFPVLQALWANSQALHPIGLGVWGAGFLEALRRNWAPPGGRESGRRSSPRSHRELLRTWLPVGVLSLAACLLNPYGVEGILAPFRFLGIMVNAESIAGRPIGELRPPFDPLIPTSTVLPFYLFSLVLLGVVIVRFRKLNLFRLIVLAAVAFLAFRSVRNIPLLAFAGSLLAIELLSPVARPSGSAARTALRDPQRAVADRAPSWPERDRGVIVAARLALSVLFLVVASGLVTSSLYHYVGLRRQFGLGPDPRQFPQETTALLAGNPPARIMNDQAMGHFLIWHLWPQTRVSFDGRSEVYDEPRIRQLQRCMRQVDQFDHLARGEGATTALIAYRWSYLEPLLSGLDAHPDWEMTAYDNAAVLFIRRPEAAADRVGTPAVEALPPPGQTVAEWSDQKPGVPAAERRSFIRAWLQPTGRIEAESRMARARMLLSLGRAELAVAEALAAVRLAPWIAEGFNHLGAALSRAGRLDQARAAFQQCLVIAPDHVDAAQNLATVTQAQRRSPGREQILLSRSEQDPQNPQPLAELGHLCYHAQRYREAAEYYVRAAERGMGSQALIWAALAYLAGGFRQEAQSRHEQAREAAPNAAVRAQIDSLWSAAQP